jgi:sterol carrier protein 2
VYVGYVYGDSCSGQKAVYTIGNTGVPIINVNNNCSTGSTAIYLAHNAIQGGMSQCVMALGFEKMFTGSLKTFFDDRENPLGDFFQKDVEMRGKSKGPFAPKLFGNAGREHMEKYGTKAEHFGKIAWKNHKHSVNNPYSQFRDEYTLDQIMKSAKIHDPLTKLQCCPTSDGAGCAILCSEEFMIRHNLQDQAVEIKAIHMTTDMASTFNSNSSMNLIGADMANKCASEVYKKAKVTPDQIDVVELHDCFSANELCTYESLELCGRGKAGEAIDRGDFTYGGKVVVNPSGGLISKGHPLGATGLA